MSEPQLIAVDGVTMTPDVVRDLLGGPGGMHLLILCPRCHQASDNVANGYCPHCHAWTGTPR